MVSFLFWNLNRKPLQRVVANLAWRHEVDVLMLAECPVGPETVHATLNERDSARYHIVPSRECRKVRLFTRFSREFARSVGQDGPRLLARHLTPPGRVSVLLVAAHLPSKRYSRDQSQAAECARVSQFIIGAEREVGHERTLLVGDLNMNPFEAGVVNANGLHAVMTRQIASGRTRVVQRQSYPFFYNPMWGRFGDETPGPPGTYYYYEAEHMALFWHMFDQVLLRPDLMGRFRNSDLEILTSDGADSLLSSDGLPDTNRASDHLPVLFKLDL